MAKGILFVAICCIAANVGAQSIDEPTDGIWRDVHSHRALKVEKDRIHLYEISGDNCVEVGTVKRRSQSNRPSETKLEPIPALPPNCGKTLNTPASNYDVFWKTFAELYPFFAQRQINWASVDKRFRPQVSDATTPAELFDIFQKMIEPLHDVATGIEAQALHLHFHGAPEGQKHLPNERLSRQSEEIIRKQYIHGELRGYCHWIQLGPKTASSSPLHSGALIHFGILDNSIGYLRLDEIPAYCQKELDQIFASAAELKALVVDTRFASDASPTDAAIPLASRFTSKDYLGFSRSQGATSEDELVPRSSRPGFTGPVALLTGARYRPNSRTVCVGLDRTRSAGSSNRCPNPRSFGGNDAARAAQRLELSLANRKVLSAERKRLSFRRTPAGCCCCAGGFNR